MRYRAGVRSRSCRPLGCFRQAVLVRTLPGCLTLRAWFPASARWHVFRFIFPLLCVSAPLREVSPWALRLRERMYFSIMARSRLNLGPTRRSALQVFASIRTATRPRGEVGKSPAIGRSKLFMSGAWRTRRRPGRPRSPRPGAPAPLSKSPNASGLWY